MDSDASPGPLLGRAFFDRDVVEVAPALLGHYLVVTGSEPGAFRIGRIVETEAYRGQDDLACHAAKGRTARTETMFGPPGHAYVYLIYGMYDLLNVVTGPGEFPSAVLIRAVEPLRPEPLAMPRTDGPGRLTRAFGVSRPDNGIDVCAPESRVRLHRGTEVEGALIERSPRIGVDYAGVWAAMPWRFTVAGSRFVSRAPKKRA